MIKNRTRALLGAVGLGAAGALLTAVTLGGGSPAVAGTATANPTDAATHATVATLDGSIHGFAASGGTPRYFVELPPELVLWADLNHGRIVRWHKPLIGPDGRNHNFYRACHGAIADSSLWMCPDGAVFYS
jgi:hypothetical protein